MDAEEMTYDELTPAAAPAADGADLGRLRNVPVELAVEIGRARMTIGEALALGPGSIVTVGRLAGEPVDLLVNGRTIARGEVVAIDEELGLRITEIASSAALAAEAEPSVTSRTEYVPDVTPDPAGAPEAPAGG